MRRIFSAVFFLTFFTVVVAVSHAADTKVVAEQVAVTKHWDPAHPGHVHECPICHRTYHQPGDSGPASPGYRRCPNCFPGEPLVTPGNYPPQPPYPPAPPAPPAPPQPPYPPAPQYPPNYYITTAELIKMASSAPNWEKHDRILIENVAYVSDLTIDNLFKLWGRARSYENGDRILYNAAATHSFSAQELMKLWGRASSYQNGDNIMIAGVPLMKDMNLDNVFRLYNKAHTWASGDKILLAAMPRLETKDLFKLKSKAYYKETEQAIDEEIRRRQMLGIRSFNTDVTKKSGAKNNSAVSDSSDTEAIIKKAFAALDAEPSEYSVEKSDLTSNNINYQRIERFIQLAKEKKLKKSSDLYQITRNIIEKLKVASLAGDEKAALLLKQIEQK